MNIDPEYLHNGAVVVQIVYMILVVQTNFLLSYSAPEVKYFDIPGLSYQQRVPHYRGSCAFLDPLQLLHLVGAQVGKINLKEVGLLHETPEENVVISNPQKPMAVVGVGDWNQTYGGQFRHDHDLY